MPFGVKWTAAGPAVTKSNICEACGQAFDCELSVSGCWCSRIELSADAREQLRAKYTGCLCAACLRKHADPSP
jgi:cysteine-rich CWC protein